nr:DNA-(apurinic or apyrimidinic site) lyase 2 isoform X1 [Tanacetum cinerariifolium]
MKIVTYNVNGLRPRISQHGSLRKLLDSLDADIICIQETKLSRQELRADVVSADGYESFFSCTRSLEKGRTGYSGVATFCKVQSAFSSNEVALPLDAEEGFTGVLENSRGFATRKDDSQAGVEELEEFDRDELLKIDSEGRCIITDHGHFVLFNIYGPRAAHDDAERIEFKLTFYKIMQKRWEALILQGRRIIVVGDLNIAPSSVDRCDAGPDFENNKFRSWFRSLLVESGGGFFDVFRATHPERTEAYTCWPTNTGGEIFNFGSRIDHILCAGSCLHENKDLEGHNFFSCHVKDCDILTQFKRCKPGTTTSYRWKGGEGTKLEDTVRKFEDVSRLLCQCYRGGNQQRKLKPMNSLVLLLMRKLNLTEDKCSQGYVSVHKKTLSLGSNQTKPTPCTDMKKKSKKNQSSQLSLKSFFHSTSTSNKVVKSSTASISLNHTNNTVMECVTDNMKEYESNGSELDQSQCESDACNSSPTDKSKVALLEWQRIQQFMQNSIPVCKGHNEQCVSRVVKKAGPTVGRRFYVCARAEGPASNSEANCGYFKWADSGSKRKHGK